MKSKKSNIVRYNRWGYFFLIPFAVVFIIFQLIPLCSTIYNSFFKHFFDGIMEIGPEPVGLDNYVSMFKNGSIWTYFGNTMIMWIMGFIPQILISLLLASWFANPSLKLKGKAFFQTVIYLPNLIMASAFAMLFFALFSKVGPINGMLQSMGVIAEWNPYDFLGHTGSARTLVAFMNFLMWFGNTTILLLAGMLGIDTSLYEAA